MKSPDNLKKISCITQSLSLLFPHTICSTLKFIFKIQAAEEEWLTPNSVKFSHSVMSDSLQPQGLQHTRLPCPSPAPGACSNSFPLSQWCHPTSSSSVVPFSFCIQSFPASGSFRMSQFFTCGGQSTGASDSASVLPMSIQDWFPLGWTGFILQSKGLSRVFSNTTGLKASVLQCSAFFMV